MTVQMLVALLVAMQLSFGLAATPVIGVATSKGGFALDNSPVKGNATLFEGTRVETKTASGRLQLINGATMALSPESRGRIYRDRLVMERGVTEVSNAASFGLEARSLRIVPESTDSVGRVLVGKGNQIQVVAVRGNVRVMNASGVLVAALPEGRALAFEPQATGASAAAATVIRGCVSSKDNAYFVTDETTNVAFQLKGNDLAKYVGKKVELTGSQIPGAKPAEGANHVLQVAAAKVVEGRCSVAGAAAAGAAAGGAAAGGAAAGGAAAGGAAAAGAAAGAAVASNAVIAGVVVAAAATGTAVAVTTTEDEETISQ